jgi:alpha-L-rhamnosidase
MTDCPSRDERLGWTGDAGFFSRTACFNMDLGSFLSKWILDMRDAQGDCGAVPSVAPCLPDTPFKVHREDGGSAWSDTFVIIPWRVYQCYGDKRILEEHYNAVKRYIDFLITERCTGLIRDRGNSFGDWLAVDINQNHQESGVGSNRAGLTPKDLIGTAYLAQSIDIMSKMAEVLGIFEDADKYHELFLQVRKAFRRRFVSLDGITASGTQTAYALALRFGLLDPDQSVIAVKELVKEIARRNGHISSGMVGTQHICPVLTEYGQSATAYDLLLKEDYPSWLYQVKQGATTIWERWDSLKPDGSLAENDSREVMCSFNHYAIGSVGEWLYTKVAGLDTGTKSGNAGFKHIIFHPVLPPDNRLTWASASQMTPYGMTAIRWEVSKGELFVRVLVPPNTTAEIILPAQNGRVLESGADLDKALGIPVKERKEREVSLDLQAGAYEFTVLFPAIAGSD